GAKKLTVALMPKSKGNAYFISCKAGADEAAKELGVELLFDGPTDPDPAKQNEIIENWITLGVDVIAAACENKEGISTALKKAHAEATNLLSAYPNLKLIMAICSPAVPGAAEAVKQAGKTGMVKVIGLGLPSENRKYVHEGVTQSVVLWKTKDLGYLTIKAAV